MKKIKGINTFIIILSILIIIAVVYIMYILFIVKKEKPIFSQKEVQEDISQINNKENLIKIKVENENNTESYIRENLSEISPVEAILGETFRVNAINFSKDNESFEVYQSDGDIMNFFSGKYKIENEDIRISDIKNLGSDYFEQFLNNSKDKICCLTNFPLTSKNTYAFNLRKECSVIQEDYIQSIVGYNFCEKANLEIRNPKDLINVSLPLENQILGERIIVKGEASGVWFFEGDAPLTLLDQYGVILATSFVEAEGDSMTTDFVNFSGELNVKDFSGNAIIVLENDNPAPANEGWTSKLEIPVIIDTGSDLVDNNKEEEKDLAVAEEKLSKEESEKSETVKETENIEEEKTIISLPFILRDANCNGKIVYKDYEITKTKAVLTNTYQKLFDLDFNVEIDGKKYENEFALQSGLSFDRIETEEDAAFLYLKGTIKENLKVGKCGDIGFSDQVEKVAFRYDHLNRFYVYLNGEVFNRCQLSDLETCEKDYWVVKK